LVDVPAEGVDELTIDTRAVNNGAYVIVIRGGHGERIARRCVVAH
jgi:hypothetical protein